LTADSLAATGFHERHPIAAILSIHALVFNVLGV